ncbi:MAG TPA: AAA family ATPase, partial [Thermomicrobiales bacterium]|nr:AAA family ATPase [Thermomicrobiales bacterium]
MILLELEINDFKQYRGRHLFAPAETGVVAIIGPNGAGKTTLFEAIEWALYQPREIRAAEIPPRGLTEAAQTMVRLRIASTRSPEVYEIVRRLRRGTAVAEISRLVDGVPEVVATGSSAVQAFVASTLIGMEHRAFVATFFTRQKELSFFGTMAPTERRREVGRLLGLETIRKAQELIADDRRSQKAKADGLKAIAAQESQERDFAQERATALTERDANVAEVDRLSEEIRTATRTLQRAERAWEDLHQTNSARQGLLTDLEAHRGGIRTADQAIKTARDELDRIEQQELLLGDLQTVAATESLAAERVADLETRRNASVTRQAA